MDKRVQQLIDFTKSKFGLNNYYLQQYHFYRNVNIFNKTIYTLCMEWFPNHTVQDDDGLNPDGTAIIEINLENRKFERVIFVAGKNYAENGLVFNTPNTEDIIKWIEKETELTYGEQFRLEREETDELLFMANIDGIAVSPPGYIDIKFNSEGKLTLFSINGQFPLKELIKEEKYALSLTKLEHLQKEQLKLIEFPSYEHKKLHSIYAIEEIFVTNDSITTIPFEVFAAESYFLEIDQAIYWNEPINIPFERKEINWIKDFTAEQAFSCEPSSDSFPIAAIEQEKCIMAVTNFLRQEYPNESGNWILKHFYRDKEYIQATLVANTQSYRIFQRKIKVMIDPESLQVANYMDNKPMLETFDHFQIPAQITITKEEAYEKLTNLFELKPYYVYDFKQDKYVLCGKLDCQYGVNASSGEVIALDDL